MTGWSFVLLTIILSYSVKQVHDEFMHDVNGLQNVIKDFIGDPDWQGLVDSLRQDVRTLCVRHAPKVYGFLVEVISRGGGIEFFRVYAGRMKFIFITLADDTKANLIVKLMKQQVKITGAQCGKAVVARANGGGRGVLAIMDASHDERCYEHITISAIVYKLGLVYDHTKVMAAGKPLKAAYQKRYNDDPPHFPNADGVEVAWYTCRDEDLMVKAVEETYGIQS